MLLGTASVLWPYATSLYSEAWQAAAFIWAAVLLLERRVTPAALLLLGAGLIKVTSLVFIPGFIVAVLVDRSAPPAAYFRVAPERSSLFSGPRKRGPRRSPGCTSEEKSLGYCFSSWFSL